MLRRFARDESGISLVETLISFPVVLLVFAAFVEFGYAMFQWNQTVKALHVGARMAAVSTPVASGFVPADAAGGGTAGEPIESSQTWTCDGSDEANRAAQCNMAELQRIADEMHILNSRIDIGNVRFTYERSGLGYYGRPAGAIVTIRVEARAVSFDLPFLGALLGINSISIPALPVTITSEDMKTTNS